MARRRKYKRRRRRGPRKTFRLMRQMASVNYSKMRLTLNSELKNVNGAFNLINAAISPRSLSFTYSPDSGDPTLHRSLQNFQKVKDLWDEYRVYYCVVRYRPYLTRADTDVVILPNVVVAFDKDQNGFLGLQSLKSKKGAKYFDLGKQWTFKTGIPRYDDGNTNTASAQGWQNIQNEGTISNRAGIVGIASLNPLTPNPNAPTAFGEIDIDIYMELRSRQDSNVRAYYGVDKQKGEVITDLNKSNLTHDQFLSSVPPIESGDGNHPF